MNVEITRSLLDERFIFNLETGVVTNRVSTVQKAQAGKEAGCLNQRGYRQIGINAQLYYTARLIWFYAHGCWPDCIDHINHERTDNRLCNLRSVTKAENHKNLSKRSDNTSGISGVGWNKKSSKWRAYIMIDGKQIHLGYFNNMADAITARTAAKIEHGYHSNHA